MFEVCFDEQSVSRLALVWIPEAPAAKPACGSDAATLLFAVLSQDPAGPKMVPAKPVRRPRKPRAAVVHPH